MNLSAHAHSKAGFTLTEIMFVSVILGFISIGLATFMFNSTQGMFWASNKARITNDVRNFTLRISKETLGARTGIVYKSFSTEDRDDLSDQKQSGETGDCLVLVYYDPYPDIDDPLHYTKLVVFFRKPDSDGLSPVYRAEKIFSSPQEIDTSAGNNHFEDFLAHYFADDSDTHPVVLELSRGLADGKLFRNFGNNTFVVNGEILHGNEVKEVTNTYNLTISPRG
ncbi:prepilin-type N-terminal cleavage/methylation domain-containing protein [Coraliomargarita sp. SDUM461004]|uniref:Prepilin-type N-terminal cleavage/methylation domain-containing protein n=1 Tax=Thalassobacterium sedimentorum TaxID=3041258 RepID=A0ABU1AHK9_9BACT|nr:prepilin-type N-terminal cleavage/methylation domain-containing protein [Coraliomargarita sp. SDUM461004]MDQ8193360.1 prepilin-type N-terminal cleavage/methylation domain-containing protein [Coraliomargarita sp. SDUM461004]